MKTMKTSMPRFADSPSSSNCLRKAAFLQAIVALVLLGGSVSAAHAQKPPIGNDGEERSIKGILDGLKSPHVVTPPVPEQYRVKSEAETKGTGTAGIFVLTPSQYYVNVMKNALPTLPTFPKTAVKRGVVRGYVKDSKGRPLKGAVIGVRASSAGGFYSGASAKSDANGFYEISVPWGVAEFYTASITRDYGDERASFSLHPADSEVDSFATAKGLVENWVLLPYGVADRDKASEDPKYSGNYYGGSFNVDFSIMDRRFPNDYELPEGSEVELTLTPDGPLLDGTAGKPFTFRRRVQEDGRRGFTVNNVPVGRYRITARLVQDGKSSPLRLKETGPYSSQPFGLEPKEGTEGIIITFRPGSVKAGMAAAAHGNWQSIDITLKR